MIIRRFQASDAEELYQLFYHTIHQINIQHYSQDQVSAWAPHDIDMGFVKQKYKQIAPYVAVENGVIIGYADIQPDGYIDHFYCHHKYQGRGVGRRLFEVLESDAEEQGIQRMYSNVSITARPFFEAMGFHVEKPQLVEVGEQRLTNYRMVRDLP